MNTVLVPINDLKPFAQNPRTISTHEFESLQRSLDEFGWLEPIVANKVTGNIVGGHMRWKAAGSLGMKEVPVVWVELDKDKEVAANIALNKISGDWDDQLLQELLLGLDEDELLLTGFDDEELLKLQDGWATEETDKLLDTDKPKVKRFTLDDLEQLRQVYESKGGNPDTASFLAELRMVENGQANKE
jgi:hypothetical protein